MWPVRYLVVAVCALSLAGCGGDNLDESDTEEEIAAGVERQTATENVKIDCPEVKREKDAVFECSLTADGGVKASVKVTQMDDDGGIRWEVNP